jgi:hypothetical protein
MCISTRSANSALVLALVLVGGAALARNAAQQSPAPAPAEGAKAEIEQQGDAAMERLRGAVGRTGQDAKGPAKVPELPAPPSAALRRRAFDAMRRRAPAPALDARARRAVQAGEATMAAQREAMGKRLKQALGLEAPDMAAITRALPSPPAHAWVPVLFVSSSMPVSTLRTYAIQLERAGGVLAFRGMPGGLHQVGPMAKLSAEILRLDPGCEGPACKMRSVQLIVDPLVFRQHGVARVPALAMIPGDPTQPYCEREDDSPGAPQQRASHIVYGDAALSGLFEEYARLGGSEEVQGVQARLAAR